MRRTPLVPVLILLAASLFPATGIGGENPSPTSDEVIDKVLAAYGGGTALAKVQSYAFAGTLWAKTTAHGTMEPIAFHRTFRRPGWLKVVNDFPERKETRILSPKGGWRTGADGKISEVSGAQLQSMSLQASRADIPWLLLDHRKATRLLEPIREEKTDGKGNKVQVAYPLLEVTLPDDSALLLLVHPDTWRVGAIKAFAKKGDKDAAFMTLYADWKTEDGVLFPVREENYAMNVPTGITLVHSIKVNPALKDKDFAP